MTQQLTITVDTKAAQKALDKLSPAMMNDRAQTAMNESLVYVQALVQRATPVNTGVGRASVYTEIQGTSLLSDMRGKVASPLVYMPVLEYGRSPGAKFPPRAPIELWAQRVLGDARLWFVVARAIARRGTKSNRMFANAAQVAPARVQAIWNRWFKVA